MYYIISQSLKYLPFAGRSHRGSTANANKQDHKNLNKYRSRKLFIVPNVLLQAIIEVFSAKKNTYNFHALSAWWLRNGVFDETMGGKGL